MGAEFSSSHVVVGSVFDSVVGKRLACCPFLRKVVLGRRCSFDVVRAWNQCSVDGGHCDFRGRRLKFSSYGIDSLRVAWICPKVVGLPLKSV